MDNRELNPYESSSNSAGSASRPTQPSKHLILLILLFELPAVLLFLHGFAYLLEMPGAEVVVNAYGGRQPIAFAFVRLLATGGLLVPFILGCWLAANARSNAWMFGVCIGISYVFASVFWWAMIGMGVMMRFT